VLRVRSLFKTALIIVSVCMLWLQFHILQIQPNNGPSSRDALLESIPFLSTIRNYETKEMNISTMRLVVDTINAEQKVNNADVFGDWEAEMPVIVIQVHTRLPYLVQLVDSLRHAKDINSTLVIFSHDVFDAQINALVQSIEFCKVMQIFYPYSIQLHPDDFPGEDPNDCPRNIPMGKAMQIGCTNALTPDVYGHYREARFAQTKHHWWWKINRAFDGLEATRDHSGPFIFLEEDYLVAPDFLHVLKLLQAGQDSACSHCNILSLGTYSKTYNFAGDSGKAQISQWVSSRHNMGMVITRRLWNQIKLCADKFCTFDDYNWDWSLQNISNTCMQHKLFTIMVSAPRVFHIGECGVHHKKKDCSSQAVLDKVRKTLETAKPNLFPTSITVTTSEQKIGKPPKPNGGWGDVRDHHLCLAQVNATSRGP